MKWILLTALSLAAAPSLWAEQPGAIEVRGSMGLTAFGDDGAVNHLQTGVAVRYYVASRFSIEPEFQYLRGSSGHHDTVIVPNVYWDFRQANVVPYVTGGVGLIHSSFCGFTGTDTLSDLFVQIGAGVKLYVNDRFYIAPEFRIGYPVHVRASVAVGYTFRNAIMKPDESRSQGPCGRASRYLGRGAGSIVGAAESRHRSR